jgi:glycosyltransferase involved in cell wall biosynthesis
MSNFVVISVIMPAYNAGRYITQSINSVLAQSFNNYELIVVDDGSTDDTVKQVLAISDPRIILITKKNGGVSSARNTGIKAACGVYIAFLDADDIWVPIKLEKQINFLESNSDFGMVYSNAYVFSENIQDSYLLLGTESLESHNTHCRLLIFNFIPTLTVMIKKNVLENFGFEVFDNDLNPVEDWDLWIRVSKICKIYGLREPMAFYRNHSGGISKNFENLRTQEYKVLVKHLLTYNESNPSLRKLALFCWERRHLKRLLIIGQFSQSIRKILFLINEYGFFYIIGNFLHWFLAYMKRKVFK